MQGLLVDSELVCKMASEAKEEKLFELNRKLCLKHCRISKVEQFRVFCDVIYEQSLTNFLPELVLDSLDNYIGGIQEPLVLQAPYSKGQSA